MQPPRPFQGGHYDKDMFTFLPAPANSDALVECSKKRKLMASDHQNTIPAPSMGYGFSGILNSNPNAGDFQGKELQNSVPASAHSATLRDYSADTQYGNRNNSITPWSSNEKAFYESRPEYTSLAGQSQASSYKDSSPHNIEDPTNKTWNRAPSVTEHVNQHGISVSNAPVAKEGGASHFQEFGSYGQQKPVLLEVVGSNSREQSSKNLGQSQSSQIHFLKPGASDGGLDEKGGYEESYKTISSSNVQRLGDSGVFPGIDCTKLFGNNSGTSLYNLSETNNLLQNALQLLRASSGISLIPNYNGNSQGCRDDTRSVQPMPNALLSSTETIVSKNAVEAGSSPDKHNINDEKVPVKLDDELKSENGASALTEELWGGTLQLSTSVSVSAVAFFKSGEKMQDFSWSESVEVKGKVRLEAFEKYVQDLPRSRTRGLMVISLCWKKGSSDAGRKGMKEVARKYKEGKRVGFAQLSSGVDMYICPHSDTIITILAKHGFFKGMTAVKDKSDPLIGCVVWKKTPSGLPATKTTDVKVPRENSEKFPIPIEGGENSGDKSPEFCLSPYVDQPEPSVTPNNNSAVGSTCRQLPDFKTGVEPDKPNSALPPVAPKQSAVLSEDEDLPEYDFRASVSQTALNKTSDTRSISSELPTEHFRASECSDTFGSLPDFRFQGLVQQNMKRQSEAPIPIFQEQQHKQQGGCPTNSRQPEVNFRGLAPQDMGHQAEIKNPNMPVEEQRQTEKCNTSMRPKNLFDDDDMPEWCPPDFKKTRHEENKKAGPSFGSSHSVVWGSGSADLSSLHPPLPPPPPPPLTQVRFQAKDYPSAPQLPKPAASTFRNESPAANDDMRNRPPFALGNSMVPGSGYSNLASGRLPPPPPPPLPPPPLMQGQFPKKDYPSAPHPPWSAVNNYLNELPVANNMHRGHLPSPPPPPPFRSTQGQFSELKYPSAPYRPRPAANNLMHESPAANNNMHRGAATPSNPVQFQDKARSPAPHPPQPRTERSAANSFGHESPAALSSRMQFRDNDYISDAHHRAPIPNKPTDHGFGCPDHSDPSRFTPNPAIRPQFDQRATKNSRHHSAWRSSRP